jgi:fatty-acyl-CoA synthase
MLSDTNLFWGSLNFGYGYALSPHSVALCDMPLFHTAGLHGIARSTLQAGGCVLVSRGFDPPTTLARLTDPALGVTHYMCVPQMAARLWNEPGFAAEKLHKLEAWALGGAPNPKAQVERFVDAGIRMSDGFGMSETCSNFGMPAHDLALVRRKAGSCGLPFMALEAKIVDPEGRDVPDGQTGELCVRGPCVSRGYWNQPELSEKAFRGGWFCTGDAALRDLDGFYYIVDRRKDMYISGGENVYPAEVEAVVAELAAVAECAVIGVPDAQWGEVGRAYVVPAPGQNITAEHVMRHCAERLAKFKLPKTIVVTDVLPRTASGKVQKHVLKVRASEEREASR